MVGCGLKLLSGKVNIGCRSLALGFISCKKMKAGRGIDIVGMERERDTQKNRRTGRYKKKKALSVVSYCETCKYLFKSRWVGGVNHAACKPRTSPPVSHCETFESFLRVCRLVGAPQWTTYEMRPGSRFHNDGPTLTPWEEEKRPLLPPPDPLPLLLIPLFLLLLPETTLM